MPSSRLYPEPIDTILKYSFYAICFLSRLWVYSKPLSDTDEEAQCIKDWTPEHYNRIKRALVDFHDMDHEKFFKDDTFSSLEEQLHEGNNVTKYERLHRIRWRRMNDESAYNNAKTIGFWPVLLRRLSYE